MPDRSPFGPAASHCRATGRRIALFAARTRIGARREWLLGIAGLALAGHFAALDFIPAIHVGRDLHAAGDHPPLFTEAYDSVRLRRPPPGRIVIALALAALGLALIVTQHDAPAPIPGQNGLGIVLALLGAVAFAVYLTVVQSAGATEAGRRLPTAAIVGAPTSGRQPRSCLQLRSSGKPRPSDRSAWFGIFGMALISQLLGHTGLNAALKHFSPTVISTTTLLEPLFAAVLAAVFLHEALPVAVFGGGALVLTVGFALTSSPKPLRPRDRPDVVHQPRMERLFSALHPVAPGDRDGTLVRRHDEQDDASRAQVLERPIAARSGAFSGIALTQASRRIT